MSTAVPIALDSCQSTEPPRPPATGLPSAPPPIRALAPHLETLHEAFAQPFAVVDAHAGDTVFADRASLPCDVSNLTALLNEVASRGRVEIVEDEAPLCLLAIPLAGILPQASLVALAPFVTLPVEAESDVASAARVFGVDVGRAFRWAQQQEVWKPRILMALAEATRERLIQKSTISHLSNGLNEALAHARDTYVELGLLHRITRRLHVAGSEGELWQETLRSLSDAVPAEALAIVSVEGERPQTVWTHGNCPLSDEELLGMVADLRTDRRQKSFALNRHETSLATWRQPLVREVAFVPIICGERPTASLLALNHRGAGDGFGEFGSVEVRLMDSIASILGIHSSNTRMFRRQGELFASSVRALTSAIDAKDRYTSGHSERVARLSVRLAEQLGLPATEINTLYLGGLLHDIGKIGIDDQVLNKPGQLTDQEFEHIKQHPEFGYEILRGVEQLKKILPIVLHHHEAWNGRGYPHGLSGEDSPLLARIVAVADSFDAMSSDRPYRNGMALEKVESILREGAGSQWDPQVIDAFFAIRDEFVKVATNAADQCEGLPLDPASWIE